MAGSLLSKYFETGFLCGKNVSQAYYHVKNLFAYHSIP